MNIVPTEIPDLLIIEPKVFGDDRGFFFKSFNQKLWEEKTGIKTVFVQDNHACPCNGWRGFDVAVDTRSNLPTFGKSVGVVLSAENKRQLWVPEGFAHGFFEFQK